MDYFLAFPDQLDQAGLMDAMLRGALRLPRDVQVRVDLHHFRTAEERAGARTLGTEVDLVGAWNPVRYAGFEAGGGVFAPDDLATTLVPAFGGGTSMTYWGYAQLTLRWP